MNRRQPTAIAAMAALAAACGASPSAEHRNVVTSPKTSLDTQAPAPVAKQPPPPPGEPKEVSFPPIARQSVGKGLEVNAAQWDKLPVAYIWLVIKSGAEADPERMPGLSHLVAAMLKEGTRTRSSAEIAEQVEFLGADLRTYSDEENTYVVMRVLDKHLEQALDLVADVAVRPTFPPGELRKLKKRELDRLALQQQNPQHLNRQAFYKHLYGDHPYAHVDVTPEVVKKVGRRDLQRWHRRYFAPNNAFLTVVGASEPEAVQQAASKSFARWRAREVHEPSYPQPPVRKQREVVVVDRPDSVQSVISMGNLAVPRSSPEYVPLQTANQVLGGSAASRLFLDLREKRSLTYGAYSGIGERVDVGPFRASASVRTEVTDEAMDAFFEHLNRVNEEAPPPAELADAKRYLTDSFPLRIDTPGKIASLISELRIFGLPDNYWEKYRDRVRRVETEQALTAAKRHINPDRALVVVVGKAAEIAEGLRKWGPVKVVTPEGDLVHEYPAIEPS